MAVATKKPKGTAQTRAAAENVRQAMLTGNAGSVPYAGDRQPWEPEKRGLMSTMEGYLPRPGDRPAVGVPVFRNGQGTFDAYGNKIAMPKGGPELLSTGGYGPGPLAAAGLRPGDPLTQRTGVTSAEGFVPHPMGGPTQDLINAYAQQHPLHDPTNLGQRMRQLGPMQPAPLPQGLVGAPAQQLARYQAQMGHAAAPTGSINYGSPGQPQQFAARPWYQNLLEANHLAAQQGAAAAVNPNVPRPNLPPVRYMGGFQGNPGAPPVMDAAQARNIARAAANQNKLDRTNRRLAAAGGDIPVLNAQARNASMMMQQYGVNPLAIQAQRQMLQGGGAPGQFNPLAAMLGGMHPQAVAAAGHYYGQVAAAQAQQAQADAALKQDQMQHEQLMAQNERQFREQQMRNQGPTQGQVQLFYMMNQEAQAIGQELGKQPGVSPQQAQALAWQQVQAKYAPFLGGWGQGGPVGGAAGIAWHPPMIQPGLPQPGLPQSQAPAAFPSMSPVQPQLPPQLPGHPPVVSMTDAANQHRNLDEMAHSFGTYNKNAQAFKEAARKAGYSDEQMEEAWHKATGGHLSTAAFAGDAAESTARALGRIGMGIAGWLKGIPFGGPSGGAGGILHGT